MNRNTIIISVIALIIIAVIIIGGRNQIESLNEKNISYKKELASADSSMKKMKDSMEVYSRKLTETMMRGTETEVESVVVIKWRDNGTKETEEITLKRKQKDTIFVSKIDTVYREVSVASVETLSVEKRVEIIDSSASQKIVTYRAQDHMFKVGVGAEGSMAPIDGTFYANAGYYRKFSILYVGGQIQTPIPAFTNTKAGVELGIMF